MGPLASLPLLGALVGTATSTAHPTWPDVVTFAVSAVIVLFGAFGVVFSRNPVHAALNLVATLFGVAVLFVLQEADFLAAVQIIVYAGAIVVLFLFVIMFLGVDREENINAEPLLGQRPLALVAVVVAVAGGAAMLWSSHGNVTGAHAVAGSTAAGRFANVNLLGTSVFTTYLYAFEATAGLLVIAVVGAVVLARRPPQLFDLDEPEEDDEAEAGETGPGPDGTAAAATGRDEPFVASPLPVGVTGPGADPTGDPAGDPADDPAGAPSGDPVPAEAARP